MAMASEFAQNFLKGLSSSRPTSPSPTSYRSPYNPYDDEADDEGGFSSDSSQPASPTVLGIPLRPPTTTSPRKPALHNLLLDLTHHGKQDLTASDIAAYTKRFKEILLGRHDDSGIASRTPRSWQAVADGEEEAMREEVLRKLVVGVYSNSLEAVVKQALQVEAEAEWWRDVEASTGSTVWYLVQTTPERIINVLCVLWNAIQRGLQARHETFSLSTLYPSTLRRLITSHGPGSHNVHSTSSTASASFTIKPSLVLTAFYPYLSEQSTQQTLTLALLLSTPSSSSPNAASSTSLSIKSYSIQDSLKKALQTIRSALRAISQLATLPVELTRQECRFKRRALERLRDERATTLGYLAGLRSELDSSSWPSSSTQQRGGSGMLTASDIRRKKYTTFLDTLLRIITPTQKSSTSYGYEDTDPLSLLTRLSTISLPALLQSHTTSLTLFPSSTLPSTPSPSPTNGLTLLRPSPLTLIWPQLIFIPPALLWGYTSRATWFPKLLEFAENAGETTLRFVEDWILTPIGDVLRTVRAGRGELSGEAEGVRIVSQEGIVSDLESLQRMTKSLAADYLHYTAADLARLEKEVASGDMTPIMQLYEEDMKRLFKSVVDGRLLRGLLVQVQKAKVDINYALRGIDHLLRSQELTFAFVGLSPALLVVYVVAGAMRGVWDGGVRGGRYGGRRRRRAVWEGIRRIEKILILQSSTVAPHTRKLRAEPSMPLTGDNSRPVSAFSASTFSLQTPPAPANPSSSPLPPSAPFHASITPTPLVAPQTNTQPLPAHSTGLLLLTLLRLRTWATHCLPPHLREPFVEDLDMLEDPRLGRGEKVLVVGRLWGVWRDGGIQGGGAGI